jgi:hypothetical protein
MRIPTTDLVSLRSLSLVGMALRGLEEKIKRENVFYILCDKESIRTCLRQKSVFSRVNSDPAIKWRDAHSDYRLSLTAFTKSGRNGTSVDFAGLRKGKKVNIIPSRRRKIESREARYILE